MVVSGFVLGFLPIGVAPASLGWLILLQDLRIGTKKERALAAERLCWNIHVVITCRNRVNFCQRVSLVKTTRSMS
jgi:hypothetical protein